MSEMEPSTSTELAIPEQKPDGRRRPLSAEHKAKMRAGFERAQAEGRIGKRKPKISPTLPVASNGKPQDPKEVALNALWPIAFQILMEEMADGDRRTRVSAALKVFEHKFGKAPQTVKQESNQVHTVRYESVAIIPDVTLDS